MIRKKGEVEIEGKACAGLDVGMYEKDEEIGKVKGDE